MLLSPAQEAALFASLVTGRTTMTDLFHIRELQVALMRRQQVRDHFDALSAASQETAR